jgi:hypothetical protein
VSGGERLGERAGKLKRRTGSRTDEARRQLDESVVALPQRRYLEITLRQCRAVKIDLHDQSR